jgi:hypothetical protein
VLPTKNHLPSNPEGVADGEGVEEIPDK